MLEQNEILENRTRFESLIRKIDRDGAAIEELISKLETSDFFSAPATTKYYGSYEGGLCECSLRTYDIMEKLISQFDNISIDETSIIIVSLFYQLYKMNYYESYNRSVKVYSETGSKKDDGGRFDWSIVKEYKVKDAENRFIYGSSGETSEFMLRYYIPLTVDESRAILSATRCTEEGKNYMPEVYATSKLTTFICTACILSAYI